MIYSRNMENELLIRTEDITDDKILDLYVETSQDRAYVTELKKTTPVILVGSRGVGKSFLMKVAYKELFDAFPHDRVMPVYITFTKSSLVSVGGNNEFHGWMMSRICVSIIRQMKKLGLLVPSRSLDVLSGGQYQEQKKLAIEEIKDAYEESWRKKSNIDITAIPTVDDLKDAVEDFCIENNVNRIVLFIDEAAHVFIRAQQVQFFTMFRDLRCPYISCNAAVYPGVTAFGNVFQIAQDASFLNMNRDVSSPDYVEKMREIVEKQQPSSKLLNDISRQKEFFSDLAYAASGNPRLLLKTLSKLTAFKANDINTVIKEFYKVDILGDHSLMEEKYPSLRDLIKWGRDFLDNNLLPELHKRNSVGMVAGQTTCYFWVSNRCPKAVEHALDLLEYTGLIIKDKSAIKSSKSEVGTRYMVNIGCLLSLEANPISTAHEIIPNFKVKKFVEFGANSPAFEGIKDSLSVISDNEVSDSLQNQLNKTIGVLDISPWMKEKLHEINVNTVRKVMEVPESKLMEAYYVGIVRSRNIKTAAMNSVYEYLIS